MQLRLCEKKYLIKKYLELGTRDSFQHAKYTCLHLRRGEFIESTAPSSLLDIDRGNVL
jgi:hypothetical protein